MKNLKIKNKLLLMLGLPFMAILFFATISILDKLDEKYIIKEEHYTHLVIEIIAIITLLAIVFGLALYIAKDIVSKIDKLEDGLISFFQYISHDRKRFKAIKIEGDDEFAKMSKVLNKSIKTTTKYIQEEVKHHVLQEKQMLQQSRNAAMGEMMRAIIHQWKQPLNGISISNSALQMHLEYDELNKDFIQEQIDNIKLQIINMDDTINDFRDFFKPQQQSIYNISESIIQINKIIGKIFTLNNINIKMDLDEQVFTKGYPNELKQVLINILNNARDAIKEKNCEIHDIFVKTYQENNNAIITITDCAGGVPLSIIDKIFDPYVTTKNEENGTGIGLDMSKTIIKKISGELTVKNVTTYIKDKKYVGASFKIKLNLVNNKI